MRWRHTRSGNIKQSRQKIYHCRRHRSHNLFTKRKIKELFPEINIQNFENLSEAEIFSNYLEYKYNLKPDLLECRSTNCGNNITYMLDLLNEHKIPFKNIIISQDATMQLRMDVTLRKYVSNKIEIINFATYSVKVSEKDGNLTYDKNIPGMWNINHFITLLMGEIPRLTDDKNGYGPKGKTISLILIYQIMYKIPFLN